MFIEDKNHYIKFIYRHGQETRIFKFPTHGASVSDVCEYFDDFLQAVGYYYKGTIEVVNNNEEEKDNEQV